MTPEEEQLGLNITEHGASTELYELLMEMELQCRSGDFTRSVTVELGSDVGQIASQYNRVLDRVTEETNNANRMAETAKLARHQTEQAYAELKTTVAELREFNELSEDRELRMIDLKKEINSLASQLGKTTMLRCGI